MWVVKCNKSNFSGIVRTEAKFKYVEERIGGMWIDQLLREVLLSRVVEKWGTQGRDVGSRGGSWNFFLLSHSYEMFQTLTRKVIAYMCRLKAIVFFFCFL